MGFFVCVFHADLHDFGVRVWKRQTGNVDLKIEPKSSFGSFHPQMKSCDKLAVLVLEGSSKTGYSCSSTFQPFTTSQFIFR